jgi:hypothetical protein
VPRIIVLKIQKDRSTKTNVIAQKSLCLQTDDNDRPKLIRISWLFIYITAEDLTSSLESLNLPTKQFVFLPVNDNENSEIAGGSHW